MKKKAMAAIAWIIVALLTIAGVFLYFRFSDNRNPAVYTYNENGEETMKTVIYHIEDEPVYIEVEVKK